MQEAFVNRLGQKESIKQLNKAETDARQVFFPWRWPSHRLLSGISSHELAISQKKLKQRS
jgi:hypothetical protein